MVLEVQSRIALKLIADRSLWIERVVLLHLGGTKYLLLAPSGDIENEDLTDDHILGWRTIRRRKIAGVKPSDLFLTEMERGEDWSVEEIQEYCDEAVSIARVHNLINAGNEDPRPLVATAKSEPVWIVVRGAGGISSGTIRVPSSDAVFLQDFCLSTSDGGDVMLLQKTDRTAMRGGGVLQALDAPPGDAADGIAPLDAFSSQSGPENSRLDARLLRLNRDLTGRRFLDYRQGCDLFHTGRFVDWPVDGPLTVRWVLRHMLAHGGTPLAFFQRFLAETRLDYSASGIAELYGWCKFFEVLVTYDQVDPCRLAACELGARRVQMVCDKWKAKLPANSGSGDLFEDSHLLLGTSDTRGAVCMSPALQSWLGEQLSKEALASKERRKAREERALAAKPK